MASGTPGNHISATDVDARIQSIFASEAFSYIGIPLIFVVLGIISKCLGRRDGDSAPHRNELAVGSSVLLMTTGKIISDACLKGAHVATLLLWAGMGAFLVVASAVVDRHFSWEIDATGVTNKKRWFRGIIFPNVVALCFFGGYQYFKLSIK